MMPSSNQRYYSRFIPSEEVGAVTQWKFGAVDGSDLVEPEPEPEALPDVPVIDEAAQLALVQQACDDAYAQGFSQAQAETALEWQRRMDDYVAQQGQELAQRLHDVAQSLEASLAGVQQKMAQDLLSLACDIAREVVRQELSCNPQALVPVVQEAVGMLLAEGRPALVRLNPDDLQAVQGSLKDMAGGAGVQWVSDAAVAAGGCLVESGGTVVDGSLSKRWERAVSSLGLQSAWQEASPKEDEHAD
jgi:flagellar assembly protein FliH